MGTSTASSRLVLGRYRMGPALGRGATSVVHRAEDLTTGEAVAVKAVPVELDLHDRVRAEVRAAGRLRHANIVALRDQGEDRECLYLVWDLVDGPSLAAQLRSGRAPSDDAALRIGREVLAALAHAHGRGVVHRDVKPANILLDRDRGAMLSDFGVARLSGESALTLTGGVVGTVAYMAPEQARGQEVGAPADVYGACLVLYEMLSGANPNAGTSPADTARRAALGAPPALSGARPDLPPELCAAIDAGLRRDPAARPEAAALARALAGARPALRGHVVRARRLAVLASAAGGGALAAVALERLPAEPVAGLDPTAPAVLAGAIAIAAVAFAWAPRAAALAAIALGTAAVAAQAPAAAALLALPALLVVATGWRHGRAVLLAGAGPALFALGLGPLLAVVAGLARTWPARLWTAAAGLVATMAWQIGAGTDALLAGGPALGSAVADLDGERAIPVAAERLWEPLMAAPWAAAQAAAIVAAALAVPLLHRARPGRRRIALCALWCAGLGAALALAAPDPAAGVAAVLPSLVIVLGWAVRPWRALRAHGPARASATLRDSIP